VPIQCRIPNATRLPWVAVGRARVQSRPRTLCLYSTSERPIGAWHRSPFRAVGRFAQLFHRKLRDGPNFAPFVGLHEVRPSGVGGGAVEKRSFVVKEQRFIRPLRCVKCGGNAHLTRRSPDPVKKDGSEIRILSATSAGIKRSGSPRAKRRQSAGFARQPSGSFHDGPGSAALPARSQCDRERGRKEPEATARY
jgi:hypothetical protein